MKADTGEDYLKYVHIISKTYTDCFFLTIKIHYINYNKIITSFFYEISGFLRQARKPSITSEIKFLHYTNGSFWDFPKSEDVKIIDVKFFILGPVVPASTTKKG